jgi:hypothetical protein
VGQILERVRRAIQRENGACKVKALRRQGFSGTGEGGSWTGLGRGPKARNEAGNGKKMYRSKAAEKCGHNEALLNKVLWFGYASALKTFEVYRNVINAFPSTHRR